MILLRTFLLVVLLLVPAVVRASNDVLWMGFKYSVGVKYIGSATKGVDLPRPKSLGMPEYPIKMMEAALSGDVFVTLVVAADGSVRNVKMNASFPEFADAAKKAIERWAFFPAKSKKDGVAVSAELTCRVEFRASE